jgi:hypothetical protein
MHTPFIARVADATAGLRYVRYVQQTTNNNHTFIAEISLNKCRGIGCGDLHGGTNIGKN